MAEAIQEQPIDASSLLESSVSGKENDAARGNSPTRSICTAAEDASRRERSSPVPCKGRLEEAACRRKAEMTSSPSLAFFKQPDLAPLREQGRESLCDRSRGIADMDTVGLTSVGNESSLLDSSRRIQFDDDSSVEMVCHRFQDLTKALRQSNSTQAELQRYLERSLDECERLKAIDIESRRVQRECERLRGLEDELHRTRDENERLRKTEIEAKTAQVELERLREEIERLRSAEIEARRAQTECERLRVFEAEARRADRKSVV